MPGGKSAQASGRTCRRANQAFAVVLRIGCVRQVRGEAPPTWMANEDEEAYRSVPTSMPTNS